MRHFGTCVLVVSALFCLLTTWTSATAPGGFAERLGLVIANAAGSNEIRAQYAGFFFAVATVCAIALAGAVSRQSAYVVIAVVFGGLIFGRLVSLALNGGIAGYTPTILALYAIDSLASCSPSRRLLSTGNLPERCELTPRHLVAALSDRKAESGTGENGPGGARVIKLTQPMAVIAIQNVSQKPSM
jgi:hypothetical protein